MYTVYERKVESLSIDKGTMLGIIQDGTQVARIASGQDTITMHKFSFSLKKVNGKG